MDKPLRMAMLGVGRIGIFHAAHIQEIGNETGWCQLTSIVDSWLEGAQRAVAQLQPNQESEIRTFPNVGALIEAGEFDAAMVASATASHYDDIMALVPAGYRVLLEKPLAHSLGAATELAAYLNSDERKQQSVMLAFQRRFDQPLVYAKELLDQGKIGRPFKIFSALEDPLPPPEGYSSPGLLIDMSVHNIDEINWLLSSMPERTIGLGCSLYNQTISSVKEDYDDVLLQMWYPDNVIGQVQVSRNHVAGYRNETIIYGEKGLIHVGHFQENPFHASVEAYGPAGVIAKKTFQLRKYRDDVPVFIKRFGEAYKAEVAVFVDKCLIDSPFDVTHEDGLRALEIAFSGSESVRSESDAVPVKYS